MAKISFCGISGSGMSSLAQILCRRGNTVMGSDRNFDLGRDEKNRLALEKTGIKIFPQDGSVIAEKPDFICASTAVEDTIPDIIEAKKHNIPIKTRPQLLADTFHSYAQGIAVGGTSGKTTTTAMIGFILDKAGKNPCMINGGLLRDYEHSDGIPNIIYNNGDICVVEADESNGSIDLYNPQIAVVTNISADHKTLEELFDLFQNFAQRSKKCAVINADYELCRKIKCRTPIITFSLEDAGADYYAAEITPLADSTSYTFAGRKFTLPLIGRFNIANALAAIAVCEQIGVDKYVAAEILQSFHGTKRRLEVIGRKKNITVIDDFAHNPDKVRASISALRQYPGRLLIMFQPHGFAPMQALGKDIIREFVKALQPTDILIIPEIFFVGGTVNKNISSADLVDYAHQIGHTDTFFVADKSEAEQRILKEAKPNDRIIIMGARDNSLTDLCNDILERL